MELTLVDNECQSCYVLKSVSVVTLMHLFMLRVPFFTFRGTDGVKLFMYPRVHNRTETIHCLFIHLFIKPSIIC